MSELYFRIGEMKGFTAIDLADRKEGYANPIRELMQNSLDASREADNSQCEVNIYIETISRDEIPHIDEYKNVLEQAIKTAKNQGSFNANSKQLAESIKGALQESKLRVLMFADNGVGMQQKRLEAMLTGGVSIKGGENSGGSYGVGNLSSYSLSSLRYVLYATRYKDGDDNNRLKTLFTGSPILAGYKDGERQRSNRGRIVKIRPRGEEEMNPHFVYPDRPPDFIGSKMQDIETGTIVSVLGLSEDWGDDDAEYSIVSNFFHAIVHDGLKVTVHKNTGQSRTHKTISFEEVERLIVQQKDNQRARGERILSGKSVYQAWQAVTEKNTQKTIDLTNGDKVYAYIKSDNSADSVIVLVRNGMVVARHDSMLSNDMNSLRKDTNFEPFTVVLDVDAKNAPKLYKLVKGAEGPYHSKLKKLFNRNDANDLRNLLGELSEKIKAYLKSIDRESFDLPLFSVPNEEATVVDGSGNRSSGQVEKAKTEHPRDKPPQPRTPEQAVPKNRPNPEVAHRNLKSKNAVRYTDEGGQWNVRLRVVPYDAGKEDEVYLSICLAEDNDKEEAKTYLDFAELKMNGHAVEILPNPSQIKLGVLKQNTTYDIMAMVRKPPDITNLKVALLPILGLKKQRKNKEG